MGQQTWPPNLSGSDKNGVAPLESADLLQIPAAVRRVLDSVTDIRLAVAKVVPKVEFVYFDQLPPSPYYVEGIRWNSFGEICVASDGRVYAGIGNHAGIEGGEALVYCWDPSTRKLEKICDLNKTTDVKPGEVRFSKVHAHIIEGKDKKIYFTGTLDDGAKAGVTPIVEKWNSHISGGKLFQYDPMTGKTIVYADFPKARVTATFKYDVNRDLLYCAIEGDPAYYNGIALGAFDLAKKKWIYEGTPGLVRLDRNFMLDSKGNLYFNGPESYAHTGARLKAELKVWGKNKKAESDKNELIYASMYSGAKKLVNKNEVRYTTLWKYDPVINSASPTNSYFTSAGFRSETRETKEGYIYGTTMGGELYRYSPSKDEITLLGSNFLVGGQYITNCVLSPDEKYLYYLPRTNGPDGFSGTPVIQYNIKTGEQKALAFLFEALYKAFNYAPFGTYGMQISNDGSALYISLNGTIAGSNEGFKLASFVIVHIPNQERN